MPSSAIPHARKLIKQVNQNINFKQITQTLNSDKTLKHLIPRNFWAFEHWSCNSGNQVRSPSKAEYFGPGEVLNRYD